MADLTGSRIGKYEIQAQLGRGGFGTVFRAFDPTVNRLIALKVLTTENRDELLVRFRNEAAAAGSLRHKNIVTIYEFGEHRGLPFIAMEFLEGEDLQQLLASGRKLSLLEKMNIMSQVADGLSCAHDHSVVHRDVKPGNIRVLPDGTVKIMDFGIARLLSHDDSTRLTRQGHVLGTLLYMAPEQVLGSDVDALCDIFAYGVMYYELLAGKHPFQAGDPRAVFYNLTSREPERLRNLAPECPEALEQVVFRALQKDRELRYQNLRDLQFDAEPILMELRHERANTLLDEARERLEREDPDGAQALLSEAADLDPADRTVRQLRQAVQARLRRRMLQPRIDSLADKGRTAVAAGRYAEALEAFQAALLLDHENEEFRAQAEAARAMLERIRRAEELVSAARKARAAGDLSTALQKASEAGQLHPQNAEARQLLEAIQLDIERLEKRRRLEQKLAEARDLQHAGSLDDALELLDGLDSGERKADEVRVLRAHIEAEKHERERQEQLSRELSAAQHLLDAAQFAEAVAALERLEMAFPDEERVTTLLRSAERELAAFERAQAIERLRSEVLASIEARQFDRALEQLARGLRAYPDEPDLLRLEEHAGAAKSKWERERAVEEAVRRSEALSAENRFDDAIAVAQAVLGKWPDEPALHALLERLEAGRERYRIDRAVENAAAEANSCLDRGDPERAVAVLEAALAEMREEPRLARELPRFHEALRLKRRAEAIDHVAAEAREMLRRREFDRAIEVLDRGLDEHGADAELSRLRQTAIQDREAALREQAIDEAVRKAARFAAARQFPEAQAAAGEILAQYPNEPRLAELAAHLRAEAAAYERSEAIRAAIQAAERLLKDAPAKAVELLSAVEARYPGDPALAAALARARDAQRARERVEAIAEASKRARQAIAERQFELAREVIAGAVAAHGADPGLEALDREAAAAKAARDRERGIVQELERCERLRSQGRLTEAVERVEDALRQYPEESRLAGLARSLREELQQHLRAEAVHRAIAAAQARLESGETARAGELLRAALAKFPGEADLERALAGLEERLRREARTRAVAAAIRAAEDESARGQFERALEILDAALGEHAGEQALVEARAGIIARQAATEREINEAVRHAEALVAAKQFEAAAQAADSAFARYPGDGRLHDLAGRIHSRWEQHQRATAVERALAEANSLLAAQEFEQARRIVERALARYPDEPALAGLRESIQAQRAAALRRRALEQAVRSCEALLAASRLAEAGKALETAARQFPGEPALAGLEKQLQAASERRRQEEAVGRAIEEAEKFIGQRQPAHSVQVLEAASAKYPNEPLLAAALVRAQEAVETQRRVEAVEEVCRETRLYADAKEFDRALETIEQSLKTFAGDHRLTRLQQSLIAARSEWEREQSSVRKARAAGSVQNMQAVTDEVPVQTPPPPPAPTREFRGPQPAPPPAQPPPRVPGSRRWIMVAGPVFVIAAAASFAIWRFGGSAGEPGLHAVEIVTAPAGAGVRVEGRECRTPNCVLDLKPGRHRVEIRLDGYEPRTETVSIEKRNTASRVNIALTPLPSRIQVSTNFARGRVFLDGAAAGELQEGAWMLDKAPEGAHELRITAQEGESTVPFVTAPARLPAVSGAVRAHGSSALVVSNLGHEARLVCPGCAGPVTLDGKPAGDLVNGELKVTGLAEGNHELVLNGAGARRTLVFQASPSPSLAVSVNSERNVGTLVVETGEDGATVSVDGRPVPRSTRGGQLRLQLDATVHSIRVQKPGYRTAPPEYSAQLGKGQEVRAVFRLIPEESTLAISGALPDTQVTVDGRPVGPVRRDGMLTARVGPGTHRIGLAKEGHLQQLIEQQFGPGETVRLSGPRVRLPEAPKPPVQKAPEARPVAPVPVKPDPAVVEAQEWEKARSTRNRGDLEAFLRRNPAGAHSAEAQRLLESIDWENTNRADRAALQAFLARHPNGAFARQARGDIERIDAAARETALRQQEAQSLATDRAAILDVLAGLSAAYEHKNAEEVASLWKSFGEDRLKALRKQLKEFRKLRVDVKPLSPPDVAGAAARVQCSYSTEIEDQAGRHPPMSRTVIITLTRLNGRWVIDSMQ